MLRGIIAILCMITTTYAFSIGQSEYCNPNTKFYPWVNWQSDESSKVFTSKGTAGVRPAICFQVNQLCQGIQCDSILVDGCRNIKILHAGEYATCLCNTSECTVSWHNTSNKPSQGKMANIQLFI